MGRLSAKDASARFKRAWSRKARWRSLYEDAYRFSMPNRNMYSSDTPGQRKDDLVFDSTLPLSTARFANRLQAELTPIFQHWAELVPGQFAEVPKDAKQEFDMILKGITDRFFSALAVSNFDSTINEFYLDLAIGTAVMLVLEGDERIPIRFISVPTYQVALEEGPWGTVGAVYRKQKLPLRIIEAMWEDAWENDAKPNDWDKKVQDSADSEVQVVEITYTDYKRDDKGDYTWYYDVYVKVDTSAGVSSDGKDSLGVRIVGREYPDNPWIVTRWSKLPGEDFGRGPVIQVLPDAKVLNKVIELILKNAAISIAPPLTAVDDGQWNPSIAVVAPNVIIPVHSNATNGARGPSLKALELPQRFQVAELIIEDLIMKIKRGMLDDQLPSEEGPVRSPTEIVARVKQLQENIGSPFGRIMVELVRPIFQRGVNILVKKGLINVADTTRINVDGTGVDVRVSSNLARVQRLSELEAGVQYIALNQSVGPEALMLNVAVENFGPWSAEKLSVDPILVRPEAQKKAMMAAMMQGMQQRLQTGSTVEQPQQPLPVAA